MYSSQQRLWHVREAFQREKTGLFGNFSLVADPPSPFWVFWPEFFRFGHDNLVTQWNKSFGNGKTPGSLILQPRQPWLGAHSYLRGHIWLVLIRTFVEIQANVAITRCLGLYPQMFPLNDLGFDSNVPPLNNECDWNVPPETFLDLTHMCPLQTMNLTQMCPLKHFRIRLICAPFKQ